VLESLQRKLAHDTELVSDGDSTSGLWWLQELQDLGQRGEARLRQDPLEPVLQLSVVPVPWTIGEPKTKTSRLLRQGWQGGGLDGVVPSLECLHERLEVPMTFVEHPLPLAVKHQGLVENFAAPATLFGAG
jgi:hypothetical protein